MSTLPHAIILNGTSSAGKSSIARALQDKLEGCYLHFQMDVFWDMVPSHVEANTQNFPHIKSAIKDSAHALLKHHHNLIIDCVGLPNQIQEMQESFKAFHVTLIAVKASLECLESREKQRGDRKIGLAHSQFLDVYQNIDYDLEVDTTILTENESAEMILKLISK